MTNNLSFDEKSKLFKYLEINYNCINDYFSKQFINHFYIFLKKIFNQY